MKTINYQAHGARTRRIAVPAVESSTADEPSAETAAPFWFRVVPVLVPGFALLIVILTGTIWASVL